MSSSDYRISRRQFLMHVGLLGGTAIALPLLEACNSATPTAQGGTKRGGEVRYGQNNEPDSLDPARTAQSSAFMVMMTIYDTLIWLDPVDLKFKQGLAESWISSIDGLAHTFKLRNDVKFHDGTPFDAQAVKFSFDRITDPALKSPFALDQLGPYQETKIIDDHTVQLILKAPYPALFDALSQTWLAIVSPTAVQKSGDSFGRNPVGTGYMKFKEWVAKDHITVERNEEYNWGPTFWNHTGPAYLDRITFVPVPESGARLAAFESGDLTIIENVPEQDFDRLTKSGKYQMKISAVQGGPMVFFVNTQREPTSDINVRRAILYGLDRSELIKAAVFGFYQPAEGPISPNTLYYTKKVEGMYPYNLEKAKSLLEEAGWKVGSDGIRERGGQKLEIDFVDRAVAQSRVVVTQALLSRLGIQVNARIVDQATRLQLSNKGEGNMFSSAFFGSDPSGIGLFYHSKNIGGYNWTRFNDADLDTLLDKQATETDPSKRGKLFEDIQLKIMQNAIIYPAYVFAQLHALDSMITSFRVNALGSYPYFYEVSLTQ